MHSPRFPLLLAGSLLFTIAPQLFAQTTVALTTTQNPSTLGAPVILRAALTPSNATGRVTFYDGVTFLGTSPVVSGAASLSTVLLPAGNRKLRAYYAGDSSNSAAASNVATQTVKAQPSGGSFKPGQFISAFDSSVVADFNGDGKADVACSLTDVGALAVFVGNGDGTFNSIGYNNGSSGAIDVLVPVGVGDFNGDGKTDLVVQGASSHKVSILLGNGDGTLQSAINVTTANTESVVVGDFNGDGKADLAIADTAVGVQVLLGRGDGTFQSPVAFPTSSQIGTGANTVMAGDFNGDGITDLVTSDGKTATVSILLGKSDGTFQPPATVSLPAIPISLAVDDLNGDGKSDLAAGHTAAAMVSVLLGKGDGTFQAAVTYPAAQNPTSLVSADIDGDGALDLAISDGPTVGILYGRGDGTFQAPLSQAVPFRFFSQLIAADFNGDGRTDLLTRTSVLLGTTISVTPTAGTPQSAAIGTQFPIPLQVTVRNSGVPVTGVTVTFTAPVGGASAVLFTSTATTDASGVASVTATANTQSGTYNVTATYQGVSATFQLTNTNGSPTNLLIIGGTPQSAALGAPFPNGLAVRLTDVSNTPISGATITFTAPTTGPTATLSSTTVTTDITGAASVRATAGPTVGTYAVTATFGSLTARFSLANLIGDSAALVASPNPSVFGAPVMLTATVTPTDATGRVTFYDGANVLGSKAVSNGTASISTTLLGTGNRKLKAFYSGDASHLTATATATQTVKTTAAVGFRASQISVGAIGPTAFVVGDFNNDGKTDFAVSGNPSGFVSVLLGNGDGTFQSPVTYPVAFNPETIAAGDFNGDGNTDLIVTGNDTTQQGNLSLSMLAGNGDGTFRAAVNTPAGGSLGALFVADVNGDGKPELVSIGPGVVYFPIVGDGTFGPRTRTNLTDNYFSVAGIADFNGDGVADLVLVTSTNLPVIALGRSDGSFGTPFALSAAITAFPFIATGDLNGDGKPDIAIVVGSVQTVYLGRGDGTFLPGVNYNATGVPVIADFNGDGIADIAAVGQTVTLLQGNGDGTFTQSLTYPTSATPFAALAADFNGDGRADIVAINNASSFNGTATILLGVASGLNFNVTFGDKQSAFVQSPFANALQATVVQDGKPVSGATVTFTAPSSGPSAVLSSTSAITNASGQALITATANSVAGSYVATANYQGASVTFSLTNLPTGTVTATSGTPQTVFLNSPFLPLQVTVRDAAGNPAAGAVVTFSAPTSGATANLSSSGVVTNASGQASVSAFANGIAGSYTVTASVGAATASFRLTNATIGTVTATRGTPQSTAVSTAFGDPLQVTVLDTAGRPLSNVFIRFTSPSTGASAGLSIPPSTLLTTTISVGTNASGVASVLAIANSIVGSYTVTASVTFSGTTASTTFSLTNQPSGSPGGTNRAQGRTATQSSTLPGYSTAGPGSAVDGNTDGGFFHGSVTATNADPNAWWQVDLGTSATVNSVVIWNRTDCCGSRLSDYWVFVSNTPFLATDTPATLQNRAGTFASHQTSAPNPSVTIPVATAGRYVRVQLSSTDYLSLAEVQVFGSGGAPAPSNLAVGKAATESSTFAGSPSAGAAVDNNTDGFFFDGSVTATNADTNAWWQVDLGAPASISSIVIWNRTDCCGSRLSDYWVFVSNTPFLPTDTPANLQNRAGTFASHQTSAPNPSAPIPVGTAGRYVRVQLSGTDYLSLAEVQVLGTAGTSTNLAVGKAANQSSTLQGYPTDAASAAVDGNTDGNFFDGSVTATNADNNAWWQVDLGVSASIDSVTIWNRTDCCSTRLGSYWIFVSDTPFAPSDTPSTLSSRPGTFAIEQVVGTAAGATVSVGAQGRYVRVQLDGTNYLSLAEVQVFGH